MIRLISQRKKLIGLVAFLLLSLASTVTWRFSQTQKKGGDLSNFTVLVERGSLPGRITATGELNAFKSVNLSPERQGLLKTLFVNEGDKVIKGQVIAEIDEGDFPFRLEETKAKFDKDKAAYERRKKLFKEGAISKEDYEEYRNRFLTSKARLMQIKVEGQDLVIRAPFDGTVTNQYAEPGAFVTPTSRAASTTNSTSSSIVELSQGLEVTAKVPESDIGRIEVDQEASVRVEAFPDQRFKAKVIKIAPRAAKTDNVTSFAVKLSFINPPKKLRIGMTADVDFLTGGSGPITLVPTVAIVTENGEPGVLVIGKGNQPEFQNVELGASSGSKTAIIKGVSPGQQVFIDLPPWAKSKRN